MKRVLSEFGAFTAHLAALAGNRSLKPADRAKLKGYYSKWTDTKYLFGRALFVDLLTLCMIFSKCMQSNEVDILGAFNTLLKMQRVLTSLPQSLWSNGRHTLPLLRSVQTKKDTRFTNAKSSRGILKY